MMVEANVSVAVSVAGNRAHLAYLFCLRKLGVEWPPFEYTFGLVGSDATMPTLQVSIWLNNLSDLYGQRPVLCALDLFDGYGTVDPKRQLGSTSHKRRVDGGEATTALALVDEADTLVFEFGSARGPIDEHVNYNVVSTMRISVRSGSRARIPARCPQRLRVYATVCLALRGSPVAIAREIWGVRSAAWWASVDLTKDVTWLSHLAKGWMRERDGYELVAYHEQCFRLGV